MRSELVNMQAVQTAGIAVRAQVVDNDNGRVDAVLQSMEKCSSAVDGTIVLCGRAWSTLTTATHFAVFFEEYVLDEAGNEIPDEVDLFHVAIFEL